MLLQEKLSYSVILEVFWVLVFPQIIYQHEALQMPEMIKQKRFNWPVNKRDMASQNSPYISTDKLPAAAPVHFL